MPRYVPTICQMVTMKGVDTTSPHAPPYTKLCCGDVTKWPSVGGLSGMLNAFGRPTFHAGPTQLSSELGTCTVGLSAAFAGDMERTEPLQVLRVHRPDRLDDSFYDSSSPMTERRVDRGGHMWKRIQYRPGYGGSATRLPPLWARHLILPYCVTNFEIAVCDMTPVGSSFYMQPCF